MSAETTSRPIADVMKAIVNIAPEPQKTQLRGHFDRILADAVYLAPERWGVLWARLQSTLQSVLGPPRSDWALQIAAIVTGRVDYRQFLATDTPDTESTPQELAQESEG